jgi:hypothetical protein
MDGGNKEYIQNFSIKMSSEDTTLCPRCILLGSSLMMGFCGQSDHLLGPGEYQLLREDLAVTASICNKTFLFHSNILKLKRQCQKYGEYSY